jgi:hypothetical protein
MSNKRLLVCKTLEIAPFSISVMRSFGWVVDHIILTNQPSNAPFHCRNIKQI